MGDIVGVLNRRGNIIVNGLISYIFDERDCFPYRNSIYVLEEKKKTAIQTILTLIESFEKIIIH